MWLYVKLSLSCSTQGSTSNSSSDEQCTLTNNNNHQMCGIALGNSSTSIELNVVLCCKKEVEMISLFFRK